jgi:protein tyrosine/serine phosphatase
MHWFGMKPVAYKTSIGRFVQVAAVLLSVICGMSLAVWADPLFLFDNLHAVTNGVVYRSAQLNGRVLAAVLDGYEIKSVLNLRGEDDEDWYRDEVSVTAAHRVLLYDVGMFATSEPSPHTLRKILEVLRTAPRPLLIHCNGGADRTGLASAMYKYFVEGKSAEEAAQQLSLRYGHFPWLGSRTVAMDNTFRRLVTSGAQGREVQIHIP